MTSNTDFFVPPGSVSQVHIIDTGVRMIDLIFGFLLSPTTQGLERFPPLPAWSFLIQSSKGEKVLFDLSIPPDSTTYPPAALQLHKDADFHIEGTKHVADVLRGQGFNLSEIKSVIWSHHHWDHIGDITTFPKTTELVVGPGFKEAFLPGYPLQPDTWVEERHIEGRTVREIDFTDQSAPLTIGKFRAYDFFGDGCFYLLDTPGHDVGHLAGLARTTTNPDTFIFMGGDICHHGGALRPTPSLPIPDGVQFPLPESIRSRVSVCPGAAQFHQINIKRGREPNQPFFDPGLTVDMAQAVQTIEDSQVADSQSNIFCILAHDSTIEGSVEFFPQPANEWKEKGWKEKTLWKFLGHLALAASKENVGGSS